jgi:hypothetical protein
VPVKTIFPAAAETPPDALVVLVLDAAVLVLDAAVVVEVEVDVGVEADEVELELDDELPELPHAASTPARATATATRSISLVLVIDCPPALFGVLKGSAYGTVSGRVPVPPSLYAMIEGCCVFDSGNPAAVIT